MEKRTGFSLWYWILAFMAEIFIQNIIAGAREVAPTSYSQFEYIRHVGDARGRALAIRDYRRRSRYPRPD